MSGRRFVLWSAPIVLVAAVLRFWGLSLGLPHLMARPDDEGILLMTGRVAAGHLDLDWAVYPSAWVYLCWLWGALTLHASEFGIFQIKKTLRFCIGRYLRVSIGLHFCICCRFCRGCFSVFRGFGSRCLLRR